MELLKCVKRCFTAQNTANRSIYRLALQTYEGKHLGFSLFTPGFDSRRGTCHFAILPNDTAVWDSDVAQTLFAARVSGEHQFEHLHGQTVARLNGQAHILFKRDGALYHAPSNTLLGRWLPAKGPEF